MFAFMNMQYQAFLFQSVQDTGKNRLFFRTSWSEKPLYCLYHTCCHLRTHPYWITPSPPTYTRNLQFEHSFFCCSLFGILVNQVLCPATIYAILMELDPIYPSPNPQDDKWVPVYPPQTYNTLFCETSAKDGSNILEAMLHLARWDTAVPLSWIYKTIMSVEGLFSK